MIRGTPYREQRLVATRNELNFARTSNQHVTIATDERWNLGTQNWTFTLTVSRLQAGYVFSITGSGNNLLRAAADNDSIFVIARTAQGALSYMGPGLTSTATKTIRLTIVRRGNSLNVYHNMRKVSSAPIPVTDTYDLSFSTLYLGAHNAGDTLLGQLGNVSLIGRDLNDRELEDLHSTNIIPLAAHSKVIAHYPLNQNVGTKAWDVVEQYNYSKLSAIETIHGNLINYSADEAGVTNPLIQSAWQNVYTKKKDGTNMLPFNGTDMYAKVPSLSNYLMSDSFAFYLEFFPPKDIPANQYRALFSTQEVPGSINGLFYLGWGAVAGSNNYIELAQYGKNNGTSYGFQTNNLKLFNTPSVLTREKVKLLYVTYLSGGQYYRRIYLKYGRDNITFTDVPMPQSEAGGTWPEFLIGSFRLINGRYSSDSFSKLVVLYSTNLSLTPSVMGVTREINLLLESDNSADYKNLPNRLLDLDFGDIFISGGNYYVRDSSGNNHHARLFNFNPSVHKPFRIEKHTGLPERTKALKFNGTTQSLTIADFNPTKEKGYTYIIGFASPNIWSGNATLIQKVEGAYVKSKIIEVSSQNNIDSIAASGKSIRNQNNGVSSGWADFRSFNNKPQFFVAFEKDGFQQGYANGFPDKSNAVSSPTFQGWNDVTGTFYIGKEFEGHIFFVGIWKGQLKQNQILDIIGNGISGNAKPSLMAECQLYLTFEEIIDNAGTIVMKDWSPLKRVVTLNNYTSAEATPGDPSYKLFELDSLR